MKRIDVKLVKIQMVIWFEAEKEGNGGLLGEKEEMERNKSSECSRIFDEPCPHKVD
jgi:hypothetical protein